MSDKSSAAIFGQLFALVAETPDERSKKLAREIWKIYDEERLDFHPVDMDAIEECKKLGLAIEGPPNKYGETLVWCGWDGFEGLARKAGDPAYVVSEEDNNHESRTP